MSRNYSAGSHGVNYIINEIRHLSKEDILSTYGIEKEQDGSVFDPTYNMKFDTVGEWAEFSAQQDEDIDEDIGSDFGGFL